MGSRRCRPCRVLADSKDLHGHYAFQDAAHYLRLTAELFSDITAKFERAFGDIVPTLGGDGNETN